ncbi:hypothetical protein FRB97_004613 [Tulasnella sp. 331]|nr:hypothetical protein FRB97_004613 [Tulasnella sp. 331]KAG8878277.1 hypothetical protein FRB98_006292 [Tulasnella sp. 332]
MIKANSTPRVIPMYLEGFDDIMPADRGFPRFMPRFGKRLKITFGDPSGVTEEVRAIQETCTAEDVATSGLVPPSNESDPEAQLRILMADILRQAVKRLGDDVTRSRPTYLPHPSTKSTSTELLIARDSFH